MTDAGPPPQSLPPRSPDDEINLLDYWRVLWKRKWMISGLFIVAVVTTMVVSFQLPKIYQSTATLLPQLDSAEGGLSALVGASGAAGVAQNLGISLPGRPTTPTDLFAAMLKSRTMADDVVEAFDLQSYYKVETKQEARNALAGDRTITVTKENVVEITVEATDPQLAADVANFHVENLDRMNRQLTTSKASQKRAFVETRLAETKTRLARAEEALKEFQRSHKTVAVEEQSRAMIEAAAHVQARIMAQEVQLETMKSYLSPGNPEIARVRSSIEELKKQLHLLESGKEGKGMLPGDRLHPAMITVPELALEYGRLMRELKVQESLYKLLKSEHEQAKLMEARDTPTVQVMDRAVPAEKKSKPSIRLNMMIAGTLAILMGIFLAFFLEYLERIRAREQSRV